MILDILLIDIIVCIIIDISGIIDEIKIMIWKWLRKEPYKEYRLKPLDCSLCMSFWIGLIYIIFNGITLFNLFIVCLFAMLSEQITNTIQLIRYIIQKILDKIMTIIE